MSTNTTTRPPTAAQARAIESKSDLVLCVAGPGSGKTFTLIETIKRRIDGGYRPEKMVAITFTNAAAREVKKRLGSDIKLGYIGTLHGFALRELQTHGGALGYGEKISVLDKEQSDEMLTAAAKRVGCKASLKALNEAKKTFERDRARTPEDIALATFYREMVANSSVDFDTILHDFGNLVAKGLYPTAWECLFVDEFQDSAPIDASIYGLMDVERRFFVGDPDQAIYAFRGGNVNMILGLSGSTEWETHVLEENFRCAVSVCQAANFLIMKNCHRVNKLTRPATTRPGSVSSMAGFYSPDAERVAVIAKVKAALNDGVPPAEIAILARTNTLVNLFAREAEQAGIPVAKKKPNTFPKDWRLARAAVSVIDAPANQICAMNFIRAAYDPARVDVITREAKMRQLHNVLEAQPIRIPSNVEPVDIGRALAVLGVSRESIAKVEEVVEGFVEPTLSDVALALTRELEIVEEMGSGVVVSTMHGAKGREWAVVFVVGCEDETIPGSVKSAERVEEERRLMFVAVTRAKDTLVMSHAQSRPTSWGAKTPQPTIPTRFLHELRA